jgi:hypothetical protein
VHSEFLSKELVVTSYALHCFNYTTPHDKITMIQNTTDTPSNSKMLRLALKTRNIECDVAVNGQEAVDLHGLHDAASGQSRVLLHF